MYKYLFLTLLLVPTILLSEDVTEIPTVPSTTASDVHGFFDLALKNDYITPRGLLVTNTDVTIQILAGLVLDIYKDDCGPINNASLLLFCWNDLWSGQDAPYVGAWNEFDWGIGINLTLYQNWKLGAQYLQFLSPPHNFSPENNFEFLILYDDKSWNLPIVFNPYIKLFWTAWGDSTVVVGRPGHTYDVEIGLIPTIDLQDRCIPLIITAPTWITVGPHSFWDDSPLALENKHCSFGVFSTGINFKFPLKFIRESLGQWYVYVGGQYYYLINDNLLQAQTITLGVSTYKKAHRNVGVASAGLGFSF